MKKTIGFLDGFPNVTVRVHLTSHSKGAARNLTVERTLYTDTAGQIGIKFEGSFWYVSPHLHHEYRGGVVPLWYDAKYGYDMGRNARTGA